MNKASFFEICFKFCTDSISGQLWQNLLLLQGEDVERGGWGCHLTPQTHSPPQPPSFPSSSFSSLRWAYVGRRTTTSSTNCECQRISDRSYFLLTQNKKYWDIQASPWSRICTLLALLAWGNACRDQKNVPGTTYHFEAGVWFLGKMGIDEIFFSMGMTTICNTLGRSMSSTLWHAVEGVSDL